MGETGLGQFSGWAIQELTLGGPLVVRKEGEPELRLIINMSGTDRSPQAKPSMRVCFGFRAAGLWVRKAMRGKQSRGVLLAGSECNHGRNFRGFGKIP